MAPDAPLPRTVGSEAAGWHGGTPLLVRGHGLGTRRDGLWASAAVVPKAALVPLPGGVDLAQAAAMGVAGLTAWQTVVNLAGVTAFDRVLVLGASGGVGSVVCSLASGLGATVWGQTGDEAKRAFVAARGAAEVLVCDADQLARQAAPLAPTVVLDPLGGPFTAAAIRALEPFGRLVLFGASAGTTGELPLQELYRKGLRILGYGGGIEPEERLRPALTAALDALAEGRLEIAVESTVPLQDVNEALERLASRQVRGKLILDLQARMP